MKLVQDVKDAWKWFSVQAMVVAGALQATWLVLPADMKSNLPEPVIQWSVVAMLVFGVVGRLVDQPVRNSQIVQIDEIR